MSDDETPSVVTILGIPVRVDATLCEPDEVWVEAPGGTAIRILPLEPPPAKCMEPIVE